MVCWGHESYVSSWKKKHRFTWSSQPHKVKLFAGQRQNLHFPVALRPWVLVRPQGLNPQPPALPGLSLKVMSHETTRNNDFQHNTALQHCYEIVWNRYSIFQNCNTVLRWKSLLWIIPCNMTLRAGGQEFSPAIMNERPSYSYSKQKENRTKRIFKLYNSPPINCMYSATWNFSNSPALLTLLVLHPS